jgi:hypothetical protein
LNVRLEQIARVDLKWLCFVPFNEASLLPVREGNDELPVMTTLARVAKSPLYLVIYSSYLRIAKNGSVRTE